MMSVGLEQQSSLSASDPASSSSNMSWKRGEGASQFACGEAFAFSTGRRALGEGSILGD